MGQDKMKIVYEDEWLLFKEGKPKPKTRVIEVWSKCSNILLGEIKWYPQWRHYCFIIGDLVFSSRCLFNIGNNVLDCNKTHKEKLEESKNELRKSKCRGCDDD